MENNVEKISLKGKDLALKYNNIVSSYFKENSMSLNELNIILISIIPLILIGVAVILSSQNEVTETIMFIRSFLFLTGIVSPFVLYELLKGTLKANKNDSYTNIKEKTLSMLNKIKNSGKIKDFEQYLEKNDFFNNYFNENNITKENKKNFYKMLNKSIFSNNDSIFIHIENSKDLNITNTMIEFFYEKLIGSSALTKKINENVKRFEDIKNRHYSVVLNITNENSIYQKINNHINNSLYDSDLDAMLSSFLDDNNNYIKIIEKYDYLNKIYDIHEKKLNTDERNRFKEITNKFQNIEDNNLLEEITMCMNMIEEKYNLDLIIAENK